ncbi:MAG: hypothetical protein GC154_21660 [bacterium]|nr:hypothetical protein [bacterium]
MGLGSQEPGQSAKPPGSPKPEDCNAWRGSRCASISTASDRQGACARVGVWDRGSASQAHRFGIGCDGRGERVGAATALRWR